MRQIVGLLMLLAMVLFVAIPLWPVEVREVQYSTGTVSWNVGYSFRTNLGRYLGLKFKYHLESQNYFDDRQIILVMKPKRKIKIINVWPNF